MVMQVTDEGLTTLACSKTLDHLNISKCTKVTDNGIRALTTLPALRILDLRNIHLTDVGLMALDNVGTLTNLNLKRCRYITDIGVSALATLTTLKRLSLSFPLSLLIIKDAGRIMPLYPPHNLVEAADHSTSEVEDDWSSSESDEVSSNSDLSYDFEIHD